MRIHTTWATSGVQWTGALWSYLQSILGRWLTGWEWIERIVSYRIATALYRAVYCVHPFNSTS